MPTFGLSSLQIIAMVNYFSLLAGSFGEVVMMKFSLISGYHFGVLLTIFGPLWTPAQKFLVLRVLGVCQGGWVGILLQR